jgi:hypothetical protein
MPLLCRYIFFLSYLFFNICSFLLMHMTCLICFPQSPPKYRRKVISSKKKKTSPNMPPGVRTGKRVRAPEGSQVQPPMAQLRSSKRLQLSVRDGQNVEEGNGAGAEQGNVAGAEEANVASAQDITSAEEANGAGGQDMTRADEDNVLAEEDTVGKL